MLEVKILVCSCDRWHKHAGRRKITPPSPESYQFACMACTCLIDRRGGGGNQGGRERYPTRAQRLSRPSVLAIKYYDLGPLANERGETDGLAQRADADGASPRLVLRREVDGGERGREGGSAA